MEGGEIPPPPPPPPPEPPETRLDVQMRPTAEAIERVTNLSEIQMAAGGGTPARDRQSVGEIVRASTDPSVVKSLNDNNYSSTQPLKRGGSGTPAKITSLTHVTSTEDSFLWTFSLTQTI